LTDEAEIQEAKKKTQVIDVNFYKSSMKILIFLLRNKNYIELLLGFFFLSDSKM
jgi:hypothetical protein